MDREIETRFPFEDYEDLLLNWAVTYTLNQNRYTTPVLERIEQGGRRQSRSSSACAISFKHNMSYRGVPASIKDFKADAVRAREEARARRAGARIVAMPHDARRAFEALIADQLEAGAPGASRTRAGRNAGQVLALPADAVDVVLCTGGSSLIPAVKNACSTSTFGGKRGGARPFHERGRRARHCQTIYGWQVDA